MSSSTKPTMLLVPGAWHGPECFDVLRHVLESHGYPTETVAHPSIGAEPPTKTLDDDARNLRETLTQLIDAEAKDVILIGHSYGGNVVSNASEGFGGKTRAEEGKKGGISLLIYLAGFVVPKGMSLFSALGGQWQPWMKFDGEYSYASDGGNIFYNDLSVEEQQKWVERLRHGSKASYTNPIRHEPWHHMRCAYIFCEKDHALLFPVQKLMFSSMTAEKGGEPEAGATLTAQLAASHSPFLSMPEKTADAIEALVAEAAKRTAK